ncbi:MAG: phosphatase PAP2 family protein [Euryarchaeota archaeon]|nr:phosphatase PAP2 family protein [Euryarchaeota archaeon]
MALLAACIILPLLLQIEEMVDLDTRLFIEVRGGYETELKMFLRYFTELGALLIWFLVVPLLWFTKKRDTAVTLLVALLVVVLVEYSLKYAVDRPRPYEVISNVDPLYRAFDPSFPSGHAMNAFAGAIAIGKKWRKLLPILLALAAAIGFSRVYIGVHYPYDVASGALIGVLIGSLAVSLDLRGTVRWIESRSKRLVDRFGIGREQIP